jgi:2-polyprenyl-6-methoxyphenol hydroxylase-like FAD-dependent oxidoreductase
MPATDAPRELAARAIVVGAGVSGLCAARALADHFERVTVLERDALPAGAVQRPGVPQGRHPHGLLGGGERALGELFPGFADDLRRAGAVPYRPGLDTRIERPGFDPFPQRDFGLTAHAMSRSLVELTIRRALERRPNVELRGGCRVHAVLATADGAAVTGVRCEPPDGPIETLHADLVVDASGRGTLTLAALEATGHPPPEERTIGVDFGYATAVFATPADAPTDWTACASFPAVPTSSRAALLFPLEGDRWILGLAGRHGDKPPGDWDGFLEFARGLRTPTIYQSVRGARRLGEIARFGFPASTWRSFDRGLPRGLLPVGDAVCRFNPLYGQGMTVAAQQACLLRQLLAARPGSDASHPLARLAPAFLEGSRSLLETPWAMAALPDLAYPETQGQRPPDLADRLRFGAGLLRLAAEDPAVHKLTLEVQHLLRPRSAYADPELRRRVEALMPAAA